MVAKDPRCLCADIKDSDQTGRMPRLTWVFAGCTLILLVLSCCGSTVFYHILYMYLMFQVPKHNYLYKLLHKLVGRDQLNLESVRLLLLRLLDRYDTREETFLSGVLDSSTMLVKAGDIKNARFQRPYKMLLVWALLMNRWGRIYNWKSEKILFYEWFIFVSENILRKTFPWKLKFFSCQMIQKNPSDTANLWWNTKINSRCSDAFTTSSLYFV